MHGCPYKTYAPDGLRAALSRLQVSGPKLEEALTKAKNGHYQLACAAVRIPCTCGGVQTLLVAQRPGGWAHNTRTSGWV